MKSIPVLAKVGKVEGRIPDQVMIENIDYIYTGDDEDKRDYETCPLNYMRALWINNEKIVEMYKARLEANCIIVCVYIIRTHS